MNKTLTTVLVALSVFLFSAKTHAEPWKLSLNSNLLLTLNSFSNNWVGGDAGSFTWTSQAIGTAEKQLSEKVSDKNTLKLSFGQTKTQDKDTKNWSAPSKSADLIDFESIFKLKLSWCVDPYVSLNLLSQFSDQRDTLLPRYLNPLDIKESVGALRDILKNDNIVWSARLGATVHQIVDRDKLSSAALPLTRSTEVVNDGGAELVSDFKAHNKSNGIQFTSTLKLYEALISSESDKNAGLTSKNDWRHPHLNWENVLTLNLAKYVMLNIYGQLLYDKEIANRVRLKETLSLGLTYSFDNTQAKP